MTVIPPGMFERLRTTPMRDLVRGRVSGALAWQRHVAICGLPDALKGVVLEVTRRTGLWRSEKVEVAQELIAHFYDGLDAGVGEEELIKRFGDVKVASKLIKRAKKRGRAWPWHVWRRGVQALLVLFVVYVGMGVWFALKQPVVSVDYVAKINAANDAAPEREHAWPIYRKAWGKLAWDRATTNSFYLLSTDKNGTQLVEPVYPHDPNWVKARALVGKQSALLVDLRSAGQKPMLGLKVDSRLRLETWRLSAWASKRDSKDLASEQVLNLHMIFLANIRKSSTLLAWDMIEAADTAEGGRAVEDYRAMVGMSLQLRGHDIATGFVSQAIYSQANDKLMFVMTRYPDLFSRQELGALAHDVARGRVVCVADYPLEKARLLNTIQHVYSDDGRGDGHFTLAGYRWWKSDMGQSEGAQIDADEWMMLATLPAIILRQYSRKEAVQYLSAYFDELERRSKLRMWEWELPDYGNGRGETFRAAFERQLGGTISWRNPWVWRSLSMSHAARPTSQNIAVDADALTFLLALEAYKRDNGHYPLAPIELTPGYLPEPARNPMTGKPLQVFYENGRPVFYARAKDAKDGVGAAKPLPVELMKPD